MSNYRKVTVIMFANTEPEEVLEKLRIFSGVGSAKHLLAGTDEARVLHDAALKAGVFGERRDEGLPEWVVEEKLGDSWVPVWAACLPTPEQKEQAKAELRRTRTTDQLFHELKQRQPDGTVLTFRTD
ncbi:MAG: hypothetical protein V4486_03195 [Patescibacteria group bacterium]